MDTPLRVLICAWSMTWYQTRIQQVRSSEFIQARRKHSAVESVINALENHGLVCLRDKLNQQKITRKQIISLKNFDQCLIFGP